MGKYKDKHGTSFIGDLLRKTKPVVRWVDGKWLTGGILTDVVLNDKDKRMEAKKDLVKKAKENVIDHYQSTIVGAIVVVLVALGVVDKSLGESLGENLNVVIDAGQALAAGIGGLWLILKAKDK